MSEPAGFTYLFERFSLRVDGGGTTKISLCREDHPVTLNTAQSKTLQLLVENHGQVIKKDALVKHVSGSYDPDRRSTVEKAIHDLRVILHDSREESRLIRTESSGYRFVAEVRKVSNEGAGAPSIEGTPATTTEDDGMNSFEEWMGKRGKFVTWTLCVYVMLTLIVSMALSARETSEAKSVASLAQFVVILIAFAHSLRLRRPKGFGLIKQDQDGDIKKAGFADFQDFERDKDNPRRALAKYTRYWSWLLLSWISLYAFLAITGFKHWDVDGLIVAQDQAKQSLGFVLSIFNALFNNLNTLMLVLCFNILNKNVEDEKEKRNVMEAPLIGLVVVLLAVTLFAFLFVAPIDKRLIANGASLVSGIAGGIAMALYVGRLQSKFLGPRPWLLIALYSYTAIQPLFVYLEKNTVWTVLLIDVALILKCLLFLYMAWLFQSGRLLFYFVRMRRTYRAVDTQWKAFRKLLEAEGGQA